MSPPLSFGPFFDMLLLRRAAGTVFYGARWRNTEVLVQTIRLKPVSSLAEHAERTYFEQTLATSSLEVHGRSILAHGVVSEPDGHRTHYWALPFEAGMTCPFQVRTVEELSSAGLSLARLLVESHACGQSEPLLSEGSIYGGRAARIAGVPVAVPPRWTADPLPWRLSPEEAATDRATPAGDLFRLGVTLAVAGEPLGDLGDLAPIIEALCHPDPKRRIPRASEAVVLLEALLSAPCSSTTSADAAVPGYVCELLVETLGDSTRFEAVQPLEMEPHDQTQMTVTLMPPSAWEAPPDPTPPQEERPAVPALAPWLAAKPAIGLGTLALVGLGLGLLAALLTAVGPP